MCVSQ
jgi:hypothetical protein